MNNGGPEEARLSSSQTSALGSLALITIGFSLYLGASYFVMEDPFDVFFSAHAAGRILNLVVCFLVALVALKRAVTEKALLVAGIACEGIYLILAGALVGLLGSHGVSPQLSFVADGLGGTAEALFVLLFLVHMAKLPVRKSCFCIPLALAGAHGVFLCSSFVVGIAVPWFKFALILVSLIVLCLGFWFAGSFSTHASAPETKAGYERGSTSRAILKSLPVILLGVAVFPFLYSLVAEIGMSTQTGPGPFAVTTEVVGIVVLVALAVLVLFKPEITSTIETAFIVILPLFATAMLLLPMAWDGKLSWSFFMTKCGYLLYNAPVWMFLARTADRTRNAVVYFGFGTGTLYLFTLLGRACGWALHFSSWGGADSIVTISLVAIWVLAMSFLVFHLVTKKRTATTPAVAADPFEEGCRRFSERYGLSEREAEMLAEYARGRSAEYIAQKFFISKDTVKTHLRKIYAKADVHNRQELLDRIETAGKDD